MDLIDPSFVEGADIPPTGKRPRVAKFFALAACLCIVAAGVFAVLKFTSSPLPTPDLEKLTISESEPGGFGFEGYMYYDDSELENDNPWDEKTEITKLPVYRNGAYDPSGAGLPLGLDEEQMRSLLDSAASALGVEVISTETETENDKNGAPVTVELRAQTSNGSIYVMADGGVVYFLPGGGLALPEKYDFTLTNEKTDEAHEIISYLANIYGGLLGFEKSTPASWGEYNTNGDFYRRYSVYDSHGTLTEKILNYNLRTASFFPSDDGKLDAIRINNRLITAEKIGDYPIISAEEAKRLLLAGNYQTSVPYAMPGKEYVAKTELIYRAGRGDQMLMPYYRFYVLLPDTEREGGLKTYGAYYVPAVKGEYIVNMPVYDGRFN